MYKYAAYVPFVWQDEQFVLIYAHAVQVLLHWTHACMSLVIPYPERQELEQVVLLNR